MPHHQDGDESIDIKIEPIVEFTSYVETTEFERCKRGNITHLPNRELDEIFPNQSSESTSQIPNNEIINEDPLSIEPPLRHSKRKQTFAKTLMDQTSLERSEPLFWEPSCEIDEEVPVFSETLPGHSKWKRSFAKSFMDETASEESSLKGRESSCLEPWNEIVDKDPYSVVLPSGQLKRKQYFVKLRPLKEMTVVQQTPSKQNSLKQIYLDHKSMKRISLPKTSLKPNDSSFWVASSANIVETDPLSLEPPSNVKKCFVKLSPLDQTFINSSLLKKESLKRDDKSSCVLNNKVPIPRKYKLKQSLTANLLAKTFKKTSSKQAAAKKKSSKHTSQEQPPLVQKSSKTASLKSKSLTKVTPKKKSKKQTLLEQTSSEQTSLDQTAPEMATPKKRTSKKFSSKKASAQGSPSNPGEPTATVPCSLCDRLFPSKLSLRSHFPSHKVPPNLTCDVCARTFDAPGKLRSHRTVHSLEQPFTCPRCPKRFARNSALRMHRLTHEPKPEVALRCTNCQKKFWYQPLLDGHVRRAKCQTKVLLVTAAKKKVPKEARPKMVYQCDICQKVSTTRGNLKKHLESHQGLRRFACNDCGARFTAQTSLTEHARTHTGLRPFVCHVCGKAFAQQSGFRQHLLIHAGEKRFACKFCDKRFKLARYLVKHEESMHVDENKFNCHHCGKLFKLADYLRRHIKAVHSEEKTERRPRVYQYRPRRTPVPEKVQTKLKRVRKESESEESWQETEDEDSNENGLVDDDSENEATEENDSVMVEESKQPTKEMPYQGTLEDYEHATRDICEQGIIEGCEQVNLKVFEQANLKKDTVEMCEEVAQEETVVETEETMEQLSEIPVGVPIELELTEPAEGSDYVPIQFMECDAEMVEGDALANEPDDLPLRAAAATSASRPSLACELCPRTFRSQKAFAQHAAVHAKLRAKGVGFECNECGMPFFRKQQLRRHVRTHDKHYADQLRCNVCNKQYHRPAYRDRHVCRPAPGPVVAKPPKQPVESLECPICHRIMSNACNLKTHVARHAGARPFVCELCGARFTVHQSLKAHVAAHDGRRPYVCHVCGRAFAARSGLHQHEGLHDERMRHECALCDKKFKVSIYLRRHMAAVHAAEKRFACADCGRRYAFRSALRVHARTHGQKSRVGCEECDKTFSDRRYLRKHVKLVHATAAPDTGSVSTD